MIEVSATEFQRNIGKYQDTASNEPVTITRQGRSQWVLLSANEYERLKGMNKTEVYRAGDYPQWLIDGLEEELRKLAKEGYHPTNNKDAE